MLNLSSNQNHIVKASFDKPIQVLASAGSGKTRVLTERVRYILENTNKDGVIALTFTNVAAQEMTARLSSYANSEDRLWISTIHSVAQRILEKYGHTVGLPSELHIFDRDKDRMEVFMQSLHKDHIDIDEYLDTSDPKVRKSRERNLQTYMDIFSRIKRELLTELDVTQQYPDKNIWKVYQDYQSSLINSNGIDYDDILVYAHEILLTHDWIVNIYRSQYKHICIDEAQDLNKAQYEFIKALCGDVLRSILMVGDPNQMIYGFNGSSEDFLCTHFVNDFSPQQFELKQNYRSTKAVIKIANKLKADSQTVTEYALNGLVKIAEFDSEESEAESISDTIQQLLKLKKHEEIEGEITLDKMVVISRNRFVFTKLEASLKSKNIPYSLRKGERQLEPSTKFGKVLDYAIRIKINSKDWVDGKKLCQILNISEPRSWSESTLSSLSAEVSTHKEDSSELMAKLLDSINKLDIENPKIPKLTKYFETYLKSSVENLEDIADDKSEDIKLSLEELAEFNNAWTLFKRKGLGNSLTAFRNALALGQLSENKADEGLSLSTVHTMKGLEKDIVFLIGMCEGVFPDYRAKSPRELEQERKSAFVAITRAKRWLYISYPKQRAMPWGKPKFHTKSRFIEEIEELF